MKCPGCNKFAAQTVDNNEPELNIEVGEDGTVTGDVRLVVQSECCGEELKEATFDINETDVDEDVIKAHTGEGHELSIENESAEATERTQTTTTRKKKDGTTVEVPIKSHRYMKHFYGVEVTAEIVCSCGGLKQPFSFSDEIQAGAMDELV